MLKTLFHLVSRGRATPRAQFPDLAPHVRGLPALGALPCNDCGACAALCPTEAVTVRAAAVTLDRGACIACGECVEACPTGTLVNDRSTRVAVRTRDALVLRGGAAEARDPATALRDPATAALDPAAAALDPAAASRDPATAGLDRPFRRSLHIREVSTGDNASDLEVAAVNNPIFDAARFGIHFVASPRHADALLVTGPVGRAMQEALRRCYEAMAEPRRVIAVGAAAISGGVHRGGYASANGVDAVLPVDVYVPGNPPHPWAILHGIRLTMG